MVSRSGRSRQRALVVACILLVLVVAASVLPLLAHGISEADKQRMLEGGYLQYLQLGAMHMITGYDHLLFLFGVIFFLTRFKDIFKLVTAFTLGHSITLVFATLYGISINYYLIDAVIALSVVYKGFDNNDGFRKHLGVTPPNLTAVIFIFGLIHGFGLSTRLQQLPLGEQGLAARILSFNAGVEIGQIVALTVMIVFLSRWRPTESFRKFSVASNNGLVAAGLLLFLMQIHGAAHLMDGENLGFNYDAHHHHHEAMEQWRREGQGAEPSADAGQPGGEPGNDAGRREEEVEEVAEPEQTSSRAP